MQKKIIPLLLVVFFGLLIGYLFDISELGDRFNEISVWVLLEAAFLYLLFYLSNAQVLALLLRGSSQPVGVLDCLRVNQFSSLFNYLAPFRLGQVAVKSVVMKVVFDVSYAASVACFIVVSALSLFVSAFLFVFLFLVFGMGEDSTPFFLWWGAAALPFIALFFMAISKIPKFHSRLSRVLSSFSGLSWQALFWCFLLLVAQVLLSAKITVVFLSDFDVKLGFLAALFMCSIGSLALIVSLTPGNLGAKEFTFVGLGVLFGVPESAMLAFMLADRMLQILIGLILSAEFFARYRVLLFRAIKIGGDV